MRTLSGRANWQIWLAGLSLLFVVKTAGAAEINEKFNFEEKAQDIKLNQNVRNFILDFDQELKFEMARFPSFELNDYYADRQNAAKRNSSLPEKVFYKAAADYLNNITVVQKFYKNVERFTKLETALILDTDIALDPQLTPLQVPPAMPNPKIEMGYKNGKFVKVRVGTKLGVDNLNSLKPLIYIRLDQRALNFQARFAPGDQKAVFEAASSRPFRGFSFGLNYETKNKQIKAVLSRKILKEKEIRLTVEQNLDSGEWSGQAALFLPIKF